MWQHTVIYNSIHILNRMKNNWLNYKIQKTLSFPDFNTDEKKNDIKVFTPIEA